MTDRRNDTLIVIPPMGDLQRPALGPYVLQALGRRAGHKVSILQADLLFASILGLREYEGISASFNNTLPGERIFGFCCHDSVAEPNLDRVNETMCNLTRLEDLPPLTPERIKRAVAEWIERTVAHVAAANARIVGLASMFEQNNASALLARAIRRALPDVALIMGGANCEGEMARGLATLIPEVDHFFSGESEATFLDFLDNYGRKEFPRFIEGTPCLDLESLPPPCYDEYFEQVGRWHSIEKLNETGTVALPYESSRGCWWGQKSHCTFCGLNGGGMAFRSKSAEKVHAEIHALSRRHGVPKICMADNIMPRGYFKTLLPKLAQDDEKLHIFYEQKSNLSLADVMLLKAAGVNLIQPGIEALDSDLLKLMRKGVSAKRNVALLRYAKACGIRMGWNLLQGLPGEQEDWYRQTAALIPLLAHLEPPAGLLGICIARFSPYFDTPGKFGITHVRPYPAYFEAFPPHVDIAKMAYNFIADAPTALDADHPTRAALWQIVEEWIDSRWNGRVERARPAAVLEVTELDDGRFLMTDTRGLPETQLTSVISEAEAAAALSESAEISPAVEWAVRQKAAVSLDGVFVPLATATPDLLMRFEQRAAAAKEAVQHETGGAALAA